MKNLLILTLLLISTLSEAQVLRSYAVAPYCNAITFDANNVAYVATDVQGVKSITNGVITNITTTGTHKGIYTVKPYLSFPEEIVVAGTDKTYTATPTSLTVKTNLLIPNTILGITFRNNSIEKELWYYSTNNIITATGNTLQPIDMTTGIKQVSYDTNPPDILSYDYFYILKSDGLYVSDENVGFSNFLQIKSGGFLNFQFNSTSNEIMLCDGGSAKRYTKPVKDGVLSTNPISNQTISPGAAVKYATYDSADNIWICWGSPLKLRRYNKADGYKTYSYDISLGLSSSVVKDMKVSTDGDVWIVPYGTNVLQFDINAPIEVPTNGIVGIGLNVLNIGSGNTDGVSTIPVSSYQWQFSPDYNASNFKVSSVSYDISGAITATYIPQEISNSGLGSGWYKVRYVSGTDTTYSVKIKVCGTVPITAVSIAQNITTFNATPSVTTTTDYEWFLNGSSVGNNLNAYTNNSLLNGDNVYTVVTDMCSNTSTSNKINYTSVPTGLLNSTEIDFNVFPNPSNGTFQIKSDFNIKSITLTNQIGQTETVEYGSEISTNMKGLVLVGVESMDGKKVWKKVSLR